MADCSEVRECPNCSGNMDVCHSDRPFGHMTGTCLECGFYFTIKSGFMTLEELNKMRNDLDLDSLDEEPERDEELSINEELTDGDDDDI